MEEQKNNSGFSSFFIDQGRKKNRRQNKGKMDFKEGFPNFLALCLSSILGPASEPHKINAVGKRQIGCCSRRALYAGGGHQMNEKPGTLKRERGSGVENVLAHFSHSLIL